LKVDKNQVWQLLMVELMAEKNRLLQRVRFFENKYGVGLADFKLNLEGEKNEKFKNWDDIIDWEAASGLLHIAQKKLDEVKNGDIELAQS